MAFLKQRGNYLYIKYYDRVSGKNKEFSTKIKATKNGWVEARKVLKDFESKYNLNEEYVSVRSSERKERKLLSEGMNEYFEIKSLKPKSILLVRTAVRYLIEVSGDKSVEEYGSLDYKKLVTEMKKRAYSNNTQGIYTAHLKALFNYFVEQGYIKENPIISISRKAKLPESIDDSDLMVIIRTLQAKEKKEQYYFIMFLLMTGFRISTAVELKWEDIDWNNEFIIAPNVKKDRKFFFPLTENLKALLREMGVKKEGKIFNYSVEGLKFFRRLQKNLLAKNMISKYYSLHQLRKTFITKLLEQGIPIHTVRALADHSNIATTIKYYAAVNIKNVKRELDTKGIFWGNFWGKGEKEEGVEKIKSLVSD